MTEPSTTSPVVLVVEDEALVRMLAVDVLEDAGFEVIEAPSADYAVLVLDKRDDIRVVFTDVDMPGRLNGFQLARHIQDHHHRVRVIIGSGKCRPWSWATSPPARCFCRSLTRWKSWSEKCAAWRRLDRECSRRRTVILMVLPPKAGSVQLLHPQPAVHGPGPLGLGRAVLMRSPNSPNGKLEKLSRLPGAQFEERKGVLLFVVRSAANVMGFPAQQHGSARNRIDIAERILLRI